MTTGMALLRRIPTALMIAAVAAALVLVTGCAKRQEEPTVVPKVSPPAIATAGVLTAGIDFSYPPYAGEDEGKRAGLDLDVAAALAEKLGLKLEVVDVSTADGSQALQEKRVDVLMSTPLGGAPISGVSVAGTYIASAPSFFGRVESTASVEPSMTLDTVGDRSIVVQKESQAFWILEQAFGEGYADPVDTLRDGFEAVAEGQVDVVAGDAVIGAYMARDFETMRFFGQIEPATPRGVGVLQDNTELSDAVRLALDGLAADGVLDTIRTKWVGDLPELEMSAEETAGP